MLSDFAHDHPLKIITIRSDTPHDDQSGGSHGSCTRSRTTVKTQEGILANHINTGLHTPDRRLTTYKRKVRYSVPGPGTQTIYPGTGSQRILRCGREREHSHHGTDKQHGCKEKPGVKKCNRSCIAQFTDLPRCLCAEIFKHLCK